MQVIINGKYWAIFLVLSLLFILVGPLFSIWSLNHLFHLNIHYSFDSYLAAWWFHMLMVVRIKSDGKQV